MSFFYDCFCPRVELFAEGVELVDAYKRWDMVKQSIANVAGWDNYPFRKVRHILDQLEMLATDEELRELELVY